MIDIICETDKKLYERIAAAAYGKLALAGKAQVELLFTDEEEIRLVNKRERGIDRETDVLSFPMLDSITAFTRENYPFDYDEESGAVALGSILICEQVAARQAEEYGHGIDREKGFLFLHGLLHLLGYDHIEEEDARIMREKEEEILSGLGLTR